MTDRLITWRSRPFAEGWEDEEPDAEVWVDVAAFDRAWRLTDQYVRPGGANGQDDRYAKVGVWFATHAECDMCVVGLEGDEVAFTDGRHRFAWLRDHGAEALPMQISPKVRDDFERRFGSRRRETRIRLAPGDCQPRA